MVITRYGLRYFTCNGARPLYASCSDTGLVFQTYLGLVVCSILRPGIFICLLVIFKDHAKLAYQSTKKEKIYREISNEKDLYNDKLRECSLCSFK